MSLLPRLSLYFKALLVIPGLAMTFAVGTPGLALPARTSDKVSFRNDVIPVLSKAGCNAGTCHGNKNGKGGFKLSLRGQDPELDYIAITHDSFSRRANPFDAEGSMLLLKPTGQIAHEGGSRFQKGSQEYEILRR